MSPDELRCMATSLLAGHDARTPGTLACPSSGLTMAQAYAVQAEVGRLRELRGERIIGYKVGCTSRPIQEQLGVREPIFGRIYDTGCFRTGSRLSHAGFANLAVEGELAVRLGRDLSGPAVSGRACREAIEAAFPVIELHHYVVPEAWPPARWLIASGGMHAGFVSEAVNQTLALADLIAAWSGDHYDRSMSTPTGRKPSRDNHPTLFEAAGEDPVVTKVPDPVPGRPRLRIANRQQIVFRAAPLDALIPHDHPARVVWDYVEGLDLSPLYHRIKSVERGPGRDAIDPKILMALWLYATVEGVGSARKLDELCREHAAFQWIAGDVSTNYHTLADFRTGHVEQLDGLLTQGVAALVTEDLVDLNRVAQDGMRVRASAGAASFRRRPALEEALAQAEAQVEALRAEAEEDPAASDRRETGARERAARERAERVKAALERLPELEARKKAGERGEARCSTTDAEATVMKMADGGFRPAYNVQFATATDSQVIVGVDVEMTGSDAGQMVPMVGQVKARYETVPGEVLVDGGFAQHDQIETVSGPGLGCTVYAPVPKPKDPRVDRHAPKPDDSAAVAAWRQRMGTDQAKVIYKERASTAECVNAQARGRGLLRLLVRGLAKVKSIALWHALAHNLLRAASLRAAAAGAT